MLNVLLFCTIFSLRTTYHPADNVLHQFVCILNRAVVATFSAARHPPPTGSPSGTTTVPLAALTSPVAPPTVALAVRSVDLPEGDPTRAPSIVEAALVSGVPFYGYCPRERLFAKLFLSAVGPTNANAAPICGIALRVHVVRVVPPSPLHV